MTGHTMEATICEGVVVRIGLLHDGELLAEVTASDPLFPRMRELAKAFGKAWSGAIVSFTPAGATDARKVWRTDSTEADAVWREAFRVVYAARCGSADRRDRAARQGVAA